MVINYSKYFIGLLGKVNEFSLQNTLNSAKHIVSIILVLVFVKERKKLGLLKVGHLKNQVWLSLLIPV